MQRKTKRGQTSPRIKVSKVVCSSDVFEKFKLINAFPQERKRQIVKEIGQNIFALEIREDKKLEQNTIKYYYLDELMAIQAGTKLDILNKKAWFKE